MENNDVIRRLRFIFDFDDVKIQVKQLDNQIRSINKGNETKAELSAEEKELVFQKVGSEQLSYYVPPLHF